MRPEIMQTLRRSKVALWTRDKIETLTTLEVRQLQANALRLAEPEIAAICELVLDARPHGHPPEPRKRAPRRAGAGTAKREAD
jgi:hypothetical protein